MTTQLVICLLLSSGLSTGIIIEDFHPSVGGWISNINPMIFSRKTIDDLLNYGGYAMISAGRNPAIWSDFNLTDEMIAKRTKELIADIQSTFLYTSMFGVYDGGAERSFLLVLHNISPRREREKLVRLGEKYNQDSIIYVRRVHPVIQQLIYTTGQHQGRFVQGRGYRKLPSNSTDNYSRLELCPNDTYQFTLNFNFDQMKMLTKELLDHHQINREINRAKSQQCK